MPRYQLKDKCCFIDAVLHETGAPQPIENPYPHVFSQADGTFVKFNDTAAFIARFIVLGVDTETHLPDILVSEYPDTNIANSKTEIKKVVDMMQDYLVTWKKHRNHVPPEGEKRSGHSKKLKLDFSTNPIGLNVIKVPIS
jgi:hypothetical protein